MRGFYQRTEGKQQCTVARPRAVAWSAASFPSEVTGGERGRRRTGRNSQRETAKTPALEWVSTKPGRGEREVEFLPFYNKF